MGLGQEPLLTDHASVDQHFAQRIQEPARLQRFRTEVVLLRSHGTELWKLYLTLESRVRIRHHGMTKVRKEFLELEKQT